MALYQHLSGVTEEKEASPQSGEWKFEPGTLRTHAFIVATTQDMSSMTTTTMMMMMKMMMQANY
jgi:hypothetical protein